MNNGWSRHCERSEAIVASRRLAPGVCYTSREAACRCAVVPAAQPTRGSVVSAAARRLDNRFAVVYANSIRLVESTRLDCFSAARLAMTSPHPPTHLVNNGWSRHCERSEAIVASRRLAPGVCYTSREAACRCAVVPAAQPTRGSVVSAAARRLDNRFAVVYANSIRLVESPRMDCFGVARLEMTAACHPPPPPYPAITTIGVCGRSAPQTPMASAKRLPPVRQPPQQWVDTFQSPMLRCRSCKGSPSSALLLSRTTLNRGYTKTPLCYPFRG